MARSAGLRDSGRFFDDRVLMSGDTRRLRPAPGRDAGRGTLEGALPFSCARPSADMTFYTVSQSMYRKSVFSHGRRFFCRRGAEENREFRRGIALFSSACLSLHLRASALKRDFRYILSDECPLPLHIARFKCETARAFERTPALTAPRSTSDTGSSSIRALQYPRSSK